VCSVPAIHLERAAYSVHEPSVKEQVAVVMVRVVRSGAANKTSSVRCSTRDGSAQSGLDYNAKSLRVVFPPGRHSRASSSWFMNRGGIRVAHWSTEGRREAIH
jgi:hypothetical protein